MIDNKLAIAGELTWQEVIESIEGFYEGHRRMCIPLLARTSQESGFGLRFYSFGEPTA